ncbi:MAG: methylamine utilization protein [Candidatus Kapabacteria bacterium]|nr:methylamine utilization protein [Candidatus Kapabacteria bacterium]MDW7996456.1 cytochrome c peroxidase [Bacteroidota bacterium]
MNKLLRYYCSFLLCGLVLTGCQRELSPDPKPSIVEVPPGFPPLPVPADNPFTAERILLGRRLFYDPQALSMTGTISCASCHRQERAFSDAATLSTGIHGRKHWRSTLPLANVAYASLLLWDGSVGSLEHDILITLTSPRVFGWPDTAAFSAHLQRHLSYRNAFHQAFRAEPSAALAAKAIAAFVRTILSGHSPYDRFVRGDTTALTPQQRRGMQVFFRSGCSECHRPPLFSDYQFYCNGLLAHYWEEGRAAVTRDPADIARFRTPSLRNISLTAPYLHDGSISSLLEVLRRYNTGGFPIATKDRRLRSLGLSEAELIALEAFLHSLTDSSLLRNPLYGRPE